ncbi:hypothetical protein [Burkholderia sp. LMG 13014]|uniref:hypothetical protein n=1 Tax=Burkholderia sp. LMG 13014 TaxID=2709306 RepID=UPI00196347F4|nr:hypothetical protein [Burkholderia sp. LMG 13014]
MDANEIKDGIQDKLEKTSKYMKGLFPIQQYAEDAQAIIDDCFDRHDVPRIDHPRVRDLNDRYGDGLENSNGFPTAGIIAQEDYHVGGSSPVIPIFLGFFSSVFGLSHFLTLIHLPTLSAWVLLGFIGLAMVLFRINPFSFIKEGFTLLPRPGLWIAGMFFIGVLTVYVLFVPGGFSQVAQMAFMQIGGLFGSLSKPVQFLIPFLPALVPVFYSRYCQRKYVLELADVGTAHNGAVSTELRPHGAARRKQMAKALEDFTWFVKIGRATGKLSARGDSFAPDAGLDFGQTVQDQRQHGFYFGAPGTGKTTSLKNIMAGVIKDEIWKEELALAVDMISDIQGEKPKDKILRTLAMYEDEMREEVERRFHEKIANYEDGKSSNEAHKQATTKETI